MNANCTHLPELFTPYPWQSTAINHALKSKQFAFLAEMGVGKTAAAITVLRHLCQRIQTPKIVIIAPGVTLTNWKAEIAKYALPEEMPSVYALTEPIKRAKVVASLGNEPGIVIVNYEAFDNANFLFNLKTWSPNIWVADELHRLKSPSSKRAKTIVSMSANAQHRLGLTGTAILNTPIDIWHQWKFLDNGETFGQYINAFRARFCIPRHKRFGPREFIEWEFNQDKSHEFSQLLDRFSITVKKAECLNLPPQITKTILLAPAVDQLVFYQQMKKDFIAFVRDQDTTLAAVAQTAMTKALRLMQIVSGFVTLDDGKIHRFKTNPKLEALRNILENLEGKIIVWCSFKENYAMVCELCEDLNIPYSMLTGAMNAEQKGESVASFQTDPKIRVMVANRKAGGIGVNLTAAAYSFTFSRNFSLEEELQADARNHRGGSEIHESIVKFDPIIEETIDIHVRDAVASKKDISDLILDKKGIWL